MPPGFAAEAVGEEAGFSVVALGLAAERAGLLPCLAARCN